MRLDFDRRWAIVLTTVVIVLACVALPTFALAADTPGTTLATPLVLPAIPWSADVTGTLVPYAWESFTDYDLFYRLYMTQGETVSMTASTTVAGQEFSVLVVPHDWIYDLRQFADDVNPTTLKLTFMAPRTGYYDLNPYANSAIPIAMNITTTTPPAFSLSSVSLSKSAPKKNTSFSISVKLLGEYDGFMNPVTFVVQKWNGKKYKGFNTYKPKVVDGDLMWMKFSKSLSLKAAKYQVQACFSDAAHATQTTKWKKFTVK